VRVLPGIIEADTQVAIVYPERELVPPQVRAFIDAVVAWAAEGFLRPAEPQSAVPKRRA
jgi:DNA-binding transcriptional LysR family regulator